MLIHGEWTMEGQYYNNCTTTTPLLQHFLRIVQVTDVSLKLFPPTKLTLSSNKFMLIDQASRTTL